MNANSELRTLSDDEVDAVSGATKMVCEYRGYNAWEQWISDNYNIQIYGNQVVYP